MSQRVPRTVTDPVTVGRGIRVCHRGR